ncbi:MAG: hypothetical protein K2X43_22675 [Hyphomonadaceae bacterium]|jgi:carbonic anhydrase/acetyltransferase-like protein (isoleucine patch superfamily)|nr:hypothetical protein [Hyphomonadaceae bacterium]
MGATILNGARIGENCLVGANAMVAKGKVFPANSRIVGARAKALHILDTEAARSLRAVATE